MLSSSLRRPSGPRAKRRSRWITCAALRAALAVGLHGWAVRGAKRAKDAAVCSPRSEREPAALAVVGNDARVLWHALSLLITALRASEDGVELHGVCLQRTCCVARSTGWG